MNLARVGHYYTPQGEGEKGSCQVALVTGHDEYGGAKDLTVNVHIFSHTGEDIGSRTDVPVLGLEQQARGEFSTSATFHLPSECQYRR
jgi:hypothetical protein